MVGLKPDATADRNRSAEAFALRLIGRLKPLRCEIRR
jgi:hypothetical protein